MKSPNCGDCGAPRGGFHHRGCDLERCPRCSGQVISCGCDETDLRPEDLEIAPEEEADYLDYLKNIASPENYVASASSVDDSFYADEENVEDEHRCVDVYLHPAQALDVLHNVLNLTEELGDRSRIARMIHEGSEGDVIRVCLFRTPAKDFYPTIPPTSPFARWRAPFDPVQSRLDQLAAQVGGADALSELDALPLIEELFDWNAIPDDIVAMLAAALEELDRVCVLAWPGPLGAELRTACRRLLGAVALQDASVLRKIENPAKLAGAACWLVGRANNAVAGRGPVTASALAKMFGLSSSPSSLGGRLKRVLVTYDRRDPYNDTALKSPRYLVGSVREAIQREATTLMRKQVADAKAR